MGEFEEDKITEKYEIKEPGSEGEAGLWLTCTIDYQHKTVSIVPMGRPQGTKFQFEQSTPERARKMGRMIQRAGEIAEEKLREAE